MVRSGEDFAKVSHAAKERLFDSARLLCEGLEEAIESYHRFSECMDAHRQYRHLGEVVDDLDEEMSWLWREGFAWKAGFGRLSRYYRFFHGIEERLSRLESLPLVRDEEKRSRMLPLWQRWIAQCTGRHEATRLWKVGWMLEELRLAQFAPGQPREMRVSEKGIIKTLEEME